MMAAVYTLNLVDRGLMILLVEPIKHDLRLSDTQLGFLTGIAFGLFYAVLGVPTARWADRGDRIKITSLAIALWGATMMTCLWVANYVQLVLARVAAAIGESGCKPPTYSLVGDYYPEPGPRTRAMTAYMMGGPLASLVSFALGGWLNEIYGWRLTFFLMGIPGLLLAAVVRLTLLDPRRRAGGANAVQSAALPAMRDVLSDLWRREALRHLCIALILLYSIGMGLGPWYAAFLMRSHGMGTKELGIDLGLIFSLAGVAGVLLGGYVSARWFADNERAQMRVSAASVAALVPCFVAFLMLPERSYALIALAPLIMAFSVFLGPTYALMQRLVEDEMRATVMAVVMLLVNIIGMGIGPQIVGALSDVFAPVVGADSLRYAMLCMSFLSVWSAYHFWRVGRTVREDLAAVRRDRQRPTCSDRHAAAIGGNR